MHASFMKPALAGTGMLLLVAVAATACSNSSTGSSSSSTSSAAAPSSSSGSASAATGKAFAKKYPGCAVHMKDGKNAKQTKLSNLRGVQYGEISLLCGKSGAAMYNTTELNDQGTSGISAPLLLWNGFSEETVAIDYEVPGGFKNGPRFWVNDWIRLPIGPTLYFNGLEARWYAYPNYPPGVQDLGVTANAYDTNKVQRDSTMGFAANQDIYVLIDPDGNVNVMQAGSQQINPKENIGSLDKLGQKLSPPSGWKYKVISLTKELVIKAVNGTAEVTIDDQGNAYDVCFKDACSYNPLTGK